MGIDSPTDIDLLLAAYRSGSHLTSDITNKNEKGEIKMKKSTMLATAAFAVLLGLFVPCTSHATEIKDTDPTTVQWDKATRKECTNSEGVSYVDYTFPEDQTQSYNSYDDAVTSLAKFTVDAVADHKEPNIDIEIPFNVKTDKVIEKNYDIAIKVDDRIDNWIRFGGNMTKREILSFSGSDWKKHENLSYYYTTVDEWKKTENGYSGIFSLSFKYKTRYDFTKYETKCLNAIKEMNVDGKSDYDKALALCKWVNKHIKYKSSEVFLGDQSGMQGMMEGWGVCNAYATLTCYLGRCLGLDILYEGGDTWLDSHAWNLVKIRDEWYYMDPTKSGHEEDSIFSGYFLQGNDWLKCNVKELDDQFKGYNKIYNISDISYANKHNTCEHDWGTSALFNVTMNLKDSTCDIPYNVSYKCTKCNAYKWEYYKDPKGHTPGKVIRVDREANCYTEGLQVRECTVCGKGYWETIPMTQHHWVNGVCTECGATHEHDWQEQTSLAKSPTCTEKGSKTYKCSKCGETKVEEIPATGHTWKIHQIAQNKSECKCSVCGATKAHDLEVVSKDPATCTKKGIIHYVCKDCGKKVRDNDPDAPALGHDWKNQNGTCSRCNAQHTHNWGEWKTTTPADCTTEGEEVRQCNTCGFEETKTLAKTDHQWGEWNITTEPSCTTEGEEVRQCEVCQKTETKKLEKTAHVTELVGAKESTCTTAGYSGDEVCKHCHEVIKKGHELALAQHQWGEWNITTPASCTHEGEETRQCKKCQKAESRTLTKTAHNTEIVGAKAPSCTSEGYTGDEVCKDCHATIKKGNTLAKTAHQWSSWKTTTNPGYASEGEQTRQCSQCHQTETRKLNKLPLPKAGTKYTVGGNQYTVLKAGLSVRFSKANPKAKTVTIPNTIKVNGINYKVAEVGANAFKNNKKVKKVTIGANVVKIANKAFNKCPSLRNVIIKTTLLTKKTASKKCFSKVHKKMVIKVPKKVKKSYAKTFKGFKVK